VGYLVAEQGLSVAKACLCLGLSLAAWYKQAKNRMERDRPVIDTLQALVAKHGRWGFWKCFQRLCLDGKGWNHKRVYRVYCQLRLNQPRRTKKRVPTRQPIVPPMPNQVWSLDFMHDSLYVGRRFRTLNVMD